MSELNAMKTTLNAGEPPALADGQPKSYGRRVRSTVISSTRSGLRSLFVPLLTLVVIGVVWQYILAHYINQLYISKPSAVWSSFWALVQNGQLARNLPVTLEEALYGFLLGSLFAVPIAMVLARFKVLLRAATPLVIVFYCIPRMALGPLFIVWLGTGVPMKVWLTASLVFFPMYFMAFDGAKSVDEKLINSVRLMGASRWQIMWHVSLPSMLSWLVVGVRQSMPFALTGAIVGELIVSSEGMGYLLAQAGGGYDTAELLAVLFVVGGIGYVLNAMLNLVENRIFHRTEEKRSGVS